MERPRRRSLAPLLALLLLLGLAPRPGAAATALQLAITGLPADGLVVASPAQFIVGATARDPAVGPADGAGIAAVTFTIRDPAGAPVFTARERSPAYCAFGGDQACQPIDADRFAALPNAPYTLQVVAESQRGPTATLSRPFILDRSFAVASVTPVEGQAFTLRDLPPFAATARAGGDTDGAGISQVRLELRTPDDQLILGATERTPRYCLAGGDTTCATPEAALFAGLPSGPYVFAIQATRSDGARSNWLRVTFPITMAAPPAPSATRAPTSPPAATVAPPPSPTRTPPTPTAAPPDATLRATQWQVLEIPLTAAQRRDERAAYTAVTVEAVFTQGARRLVVRGFWDGADRWVVRWTPPTSGAWGYQIRSTPDDPGLRQAGTIQAAAGAGPGFLRAERSSPDRYRFDTGERVLLIGITAYEVVKQARAGGTSYQAAFRQYRQHQIRKVRLLVSPWATNPRKPSRYPDSTPFRDGDHDRLDLAHIAALDAVVHTAARAGLIADLIVFTDTARSFGSEAQDTRFLRYVLARYAAFPHVIFTLTNEWNLTGKPASYWNRLGALARAEDPWMVEDGRLRPLSIHQGHDLSFAFAPAGWPSHAVVQYNHRAGLPFGDQWGHAAILANLRFGMPVINDEIGYVGQRAGAITVDRDQLRRALWATVVAGGAASFGDATLVDGGLIYKSGDWFDLGPIYDEVGYMAAAVTRLPGWWELRAAQELLEGGSRVYAARASSGAALVYAAAGGSVTLRVPSGSYQLTQVDPRSGAAVSLPSQRGDRVRWTPPSTADWALLIQPAAARTDDAGGEGYRVYLPVIGE